MAKIVLGMGVSHSPQLSTPAETWAAHAERDRHNPEIDFEAQARTAPDWLKDHLTREVWEQKYQACERAIAEMGRILQEVSPDILVVIGDDQKELFLRDNMPAFSVFWGKEIYDLPQDVEKLPPSIQPAYWARHGVVPEAYPTEPNLGRHIVETLIHQEFDVSQFTEQPAGRSIGHAHTFIRRRLLIDQPMTTMVPVMINTFFAPNVPSPKRCYDFGRSIRQAIESWDSDQTVAVIASGGLTHFTIDEDLDQRVLTGIQNKDRESLITIPRERFVSGTSEILNWIAAAGALEGLDMDVIDYVPTYRSIAGTGCGMGFVVWK
ncbi:protocatechuate 3,4-dioxygenase [Ammoniphilus sp. YIM 78166]|uniref:DODA-type extradiol aromatic ring-opening family dioxygenase n=1 Tax=Ammoniphilus sp. YIM 78166 TaxID=1644106 RepID=UPI00106F28C0|nr:protocatechuate 3,4-dioxygenase [Ammoniphilus sp. YIM 78166]